MPSRSLSDLHPDLQVLCQQFLDNCAQAGIKVGLSCTYRSCEEQDEDYAVGRTEPGKIITNAKAGQSAHNTTINGNPAACAFDFFVYNQDNTTADWNAEDDRWRQVINIGQALGLISGVSFKFRDSAHMEMANWKDKT